MVWRTRHQHQRSRHPLPGQTPAQGLTGAPGWAGLRHATQVQGRQRDFPFPGLPEACKILPRHLPLLLGQAGSSPGPLAPTAEGRRAPSQYLLWEEATETGSGSPLRHSTWREGGKGMGWAGRDLLGQRRLPEGCALRRQEEEEEEDAGRDTAQQPSHQPGLPLLTCAAVRCDRQGPAFIWLLTVPLTWLLPRHLQDSVIAGVLRLGAGGQTGRGHVCSLLAWLSRRTRLLSSFQPSHEVGLGQGTVCSRARQVSEARGGSTAAGICQYQTGPSPQ